MRVISQDETIDMPYDNTIILRNECTIYGVVPERQTRMLARYPDESKAIIAMNLLHKAYYSGDKVFQF